MTTQAHKISAIRDTPLTQRERLVIDPNVLVPRTTQLLTEELRIALSIPLKRTDCANTCAAQAAKGVANIHNYPAKPTQKHTKERGQSPGILNKKTSNGAHNATPSNNTTNKASKREGTQQGPRGKEPGKQNGNNGSKKSMEKDDSDGQQNKGSRKRARLVWTPALHQRFVEAVNCLGVRNAVPKTIMQLMNVDGLTRENVASHLQKYRLYLKRLEGDMEMFTG